MAELKEQIEKMEKDIRSLAADLKCVKEKMQNNNTLLKDELVVVLESSVANIGAAKKIGRV